MAKYDELLNALRGEKDSRNNGLLFILAANAIEELNAKYKKALSDVVRLSKPQWIPIKSRPMDEEERQYYSEHIGYDLTDDEAVIYCCELPDDDEEVLTCNRYGDVRMDTFSIDPGYGCYFEDNGEMDGIVAWMRKPKPYEPPKEKTE